MNKILILIISSYIYLLANEAFKPIPKHIEINKTKAFLGKKLFFDTRLSKDGSISCASCHDFNKGGADGFKNAIGINKAVGVVNTPTIFNAVFNISQNWNGSADTLHNQAKGPILSNIEMNSSFELIIERLSNDSDYLNDFKQIYHEKPNEQNILDAISEYEKSLITPNSRFDLYLDGNKSALTKEEIEGFELFKQKGCVACHNGINLGGNMYQKLGVMIDAPESIKRWLGRYDVTKDEDDKYFLKVPTLRNVSLTAPYYHDGRIDSLKKAVEKMIYHQLGEIPKENEVNKIVLFLDTLKGELLDVEKN